MCTLYPLPASCTPLLAHAQKELLTFADATTTSTNPNRKMTSRGEAVPITSSMATGSRESSWMLLKRRMNLQA